VNSDSRVTEEGLGTSGGDDNLLVGALELVGEGSDDTELELLLGVVAGDGEEGTAGEDFLVDLRVKGKRVSDFGAKEAAPVHSGGKEEVREE
jgi:hypothetical protein